MRVGFSVPDGPDRTDVPPDKSVPLPRLAFAAYRGTWMGGVTKLNRLLAGSPDAGFGHVRERIAEAFRRVSPLAGDTAPELDFWAMIQAEWQREDKLAQGSDYAAATARHLDKTRALIADLRPGEAAAAELEQLAALAARPDMNLDQQRAVYLRTRWLKRHVLLSNPLMQFGPTAVCQTRADVVQPSGDAVFRLAGASRRRPVRAGPSGPVAGGPRPARRQTRQRQRAGTAALVRRPTDHLLLLQVYAGRSRSTTSTKCAPTARTCAS